MKRFFIFILLVFACAERDINMRIGDEGCEILDNQNEYRFKCNEVELSLSKENLLISIIRNQSIIWQSSEYSSDNEFSPFAFKYEDQYISAKRSNLLKKNKNFLEVELFCERGNRIGSLEIRYEDEVFFITLKNNLQKLNRFGISLLLKDGYNYYGIGELTDENDIWRKLYHPTEQHFILNNGSFERPYFQTDEGTDVISPLIFNSKGGFLFIDSYSYLDISFNRDKNKILKLHIVPEYGENSIEFAFYAGKSTLKAYNKWVNRNWRNRPKLPVGTAPDEELIKKPIWTTWAQYKWAIDQEKVINFVDSILNNDLPASYIEIDDRWTAKYGDLDFAIDKFPDAKGMIDYIHKKGIKVSLWVPPFVNQDADSFEDGVKKRAFVAAYNSRYPALVGWWNSANIANAGLIDFFSDNGRDWFGEKIDYLIKNYGIDGFKYDAGEAQFLPLNPRLQEGIFPNMYSDYYARWGLKYKGVEMRSGYFSQNLPILFRQFDKASHWGFNNGLASVMTQILAMGIVGYPFILPDMIGGNEYLNKASEELYIRWVELNTFLPYMQFSIPPFREDFSNKALEITKKFIAIRNGIIKDIVEASKESALTQIPIVRPLFFEFEDDEVAYSIEDEFMLTSKYLVAPIIVEGSTKRNIYFPPARFKSIYDSSEIIQGPKWIEDYPAPIDQIPVFIRVE